MYLQEVQKHSSRNFFHQNFPNLKSLSYKTRCMRPLGSVGLTYCACLGHEGDGLVHAPTLGADVPLTPRTHVRYLFLQETTQ